MELRDLHEQLRGDLPDVISRLRAKVRAHATDLPGRQGGYRIRAVDDTAVVKIYDEIWWLGVNAQDLAADLDDIDTPNIRVEINSPGGDVFDGIAIYNALRAHPARIVTRVDGVAASIASVIAQAGDERIMLSASQMMIHNAWGMTVGDAADHDEMRQLLEQQDEVIAGIYSSRSGLPVAKFRDLMAAETWMTAQVAVDHGLADAVVEPNTKPAASDRTLHDEIRDAMGVVSAAVDSAERVAALRADAGKSLSVVNRESLDGLRTAVARLDGLCRTPDDVPKVDVANEYARFIALTQEYSS